MASARGARDAPTGVPDTVVLPAELWDAVDLLAGYMGTDRSGVLRALIVDAHAREMTKAHPIRRGSRG